MPITRLTFEGRCDRTRYSILREIEGPIVRVGYYSPDSPRACAVRVIEAPTSQYYLRATKTDGPPQTEEAAYWFTRAVYEHVRRPVWYLFGGTRTLFIYPPPPNDGDIVYVEIEEAFLYEKPTQPDDLAKIGQELDRTRPDLR